MHLDNVETDKPETAETLTPAQIALAMSIYASASKEEKAKMRKAGSGPSKKVSPLASFVASVATFKTAKERKETIVAHVSTETEPSRVRVWREPTVKSAKDAFALGHRVASVVKDLDTTVSFGGKGGKILVSDNAHTVQCARLLVEALEDAKENGLPRNHPERRAIVAALRNVATL